MIEEQRRRLADLKQKAAAEAQCQWEALHGQPFFPPTSSPLMHHSILHHHPPGGLGRRGDEPECAYDTLSLESSDSLETNLSTSGNSACSPDNVSRYRQQEKMPVLLPLSPTAPRHACSWSWEARRQVGSGRDPVA